MFHRNPLRGFGAPGGRNLPIPITLAIGFYNSLQLHYRASRDSLSTCIILYKASDTLESFLSKVAFESDFRKKTCMCVMKTFAIFLLSKETLTIRTCSILESFFRKLLSKATFERKSKENFLVCHYLKQSAMCVFIVQLYYTCVTPVTLQ